MLKNHEIVLAAYLKQCLFRFQRRHVVQLTQQMVQITQLITYSHYGVVRKLEVELLVILNYHEIVFAAHAVQRLFAVQRCNC